MASEDLVSEAKGMAFVGVGIAFGILSRLERKGIFATEDVDGVLQGVLASLEQLLPATDPAVQKARVFVDILAGVAAARRPIPQSNEQAST